MLELPMEPVRDAQNFSGVFTLIYGDPKIGKSTLASTFPDAFFIATEAGLRFLNVMKEPCGDWQKFKDIVKALREPKYKERYKTIVIDTVDLLYQACMDFVCEENNMTYPADEEWGKGWAKVRDEFQKGMRHLTAEGYGVVLISHTKVTEVEIRGRKVPKTVPTFSGSARRVIMPLVDYIFYIANDVDNPESTIRRIYCRNTIQFECGTRQKHFPEAIDEVSYDGLQEAFLQAEAIERELNNE